MTAIKLENITINFGTHIVLKDINLEIEEGSFVSVVGPNGGGKSTLIKLLLGLIKPNTGKALLYGKEPEKMLAAMIGYVPQIKTLDRSFPAMPVELVATGITGKWPGILTPAREKVSIEALEQVGAAHLAKRQLSKLSGGEMQKVYLARSIVRKPKLLLLDEPSTGIDSASEKDLNKFIDDYHSSTNATFIMATHDWEAAFHHSSEVLLINRSVICFAKPEEAFCDENMRKAFGHIGHPHDMIFGAMQHD